MSGIKSDGGVSGIKVLPNPGAATGAVGPDGKHTDEVRPGMTAPADITFSQHPGHGSAGRTVREAGPTSEYQN